MVEYKSTERNTPKHNFKYIIGEKYIFRQINNTIQNEFQEEM
jgi:hypothetical protein